MEEKAMTQKAFFAEALDHPPYLQTSNNPTDTKYSSDAIEEDVVFK
jgi:hypothetical protein